MSETKYFAPVVPVTDRSFMLKGKLKGKRLVIKDGIAAVTDKAIIAALTESKAYKEVEAPKKAAASEVSPVAAALAAGKAPAPTSSTEGTTTAGITTSALANLKTQN